MTESPKRQLPAAYQLRIAGHLDKHWSAWFGDLDLAHEDDGTTSLTGAIADQAELHGLLSKIRDLGVTLISLTVLDRPDTGCPTKTAPSDKDEVVGEARHTPDGGSRNAGIPRDPCDV